jgi:TP901 family phage tail tape measure protein
MDKTAAGTEEIGGALMKVASTADNMGVSVEQAASWIAAISSKTRESFSTIGNSMKGILARYIQIREKGFNEEDATNINMVTKALKDVGIVAIDDKGQLRNFGDVIKSLEIPSNTR